MYTYCHAMLIKLLKIHGVWYLLIIFIDCKQLFPGIVVRYMLKAMCYGSDEARQKFPRLLQIVALYPETLDAFVNKVREEIKYQGEMGRFEGQI